MAEVRLLEDRRTYARVGWTLLGGLVLSIAVMVLGLVLVAVKGVRASAHALPLDAEFAHLARGDPQSVLDLGILLLFATPIAGVVIAGAEFLRQRDMSFATVSVALLLLLAAGFFIALR